MRILLALIALAAAIAAVVVIVPDDAAEPGRGGAVTLVGDSLNVGTEPYLREELAKWRIVARDRVGRPTTEGLAELRARRTSLAPVVVVSLGTNDAEGSEEEFRTLVDEAIAIVGSDRCLVWATIVRGGDQRAGFNRILEDAASANPNVRLVEWASMIAEDGSLLATDYTHATPEGYARRAEETARVVQSCPARGSGQT